MINADQDTLTHRAQAHRPTAWADHITDWHRHYRPGHVDQHITTG
ncbi:hypothetical protein [Nocardiopsis sp. YSL2]|nr:hypothetical protein [Nocardiopsis sp. YSL2]